MKLEVKQRLEIPDGLHAGVIIDVEYRDTPYQYTDIVIEFPVTYGKIEGLRKDQVAKTAVLKAGYPTSISMASKLGKLLYRFHAVLDVGKMLDPNIILIGKKCQFQTLEEKTEKGTFARVLPESVKPI